MTRLDLIPKRSQLNNTTVTVHSMKTPPLTLYLLQSGHEEKLYPGWVDAEEDNSSRGRSVTLRLRKERKPLLVTSPRSRVNICILAFSNPLHCHCLTLVNLYRMSDFTSLVTVKEEHSPPPPQRNQVCSFLHPPLESV